MSHAETVRQFGEVSVQLSASLAGFEPDFVGRSAGSIRRELDLLASSPVEGGPHPRERAVVDDAERLLGRLAGP